MIVQVPFWTRPAALENGSREVLLIAIPVSKPAWLVTNGKSRFVTHWSMRKSERGVALSMKRGIGSVELAAFALEFAA